MGEEKKMRVAIEVELEVSATYKAEVSPDDVLEKLKSTHPEGPGSALAGAVANLLFGNGFPLNEVRHMRSVFKWDKDGSLHEFVTFKSDDY